MEKVEIKSFNVTSIPLSGKNLIEASAGTGKTYSIAVLVLRVLLEKNLSVKELLLVTFTDAAVAELDERVRNFIREAYALLVNEKENESKDAIGEILRKALKETSREELVKKLKNAILLLDELEVSTIHSFCNNSQKQFAFETNQLFDKQLVKDNSDLIRLAVNEYWRKNITSLPVQYLELLRSRDFDISVLRNAVKKTLNGYEFAGKTALELNQIFKGIDGGLEKIEAHKKELESYVPEVSLALPNVRKSALRDELIAIASDKELFIEKYLANIYSSKPSKTLTGNKIPESFLEALSCFEELKNEYDLAIVRLSSYLIQHCVKQSVAKVNAVKKNNSLQTYTDMIDGLHKAITKKDNERIVKSLKKKYKVVFIDEFQDTDKVQYEIFYEAFGNKKYDALEGVYATTVFYIGDPKQSIYGFRQANLQTYNQAKKVSNVYTMETNFRSVPAYLEAMNTFFSTPNDSFFIDQTIQYVHVKASNGWLEKEGLKRTLDVCPVSFIPMGAKGIVTATNEVVSLLEEGTIDGKPVCPSDIGILVRSKTHAKEFKKILSRARVPATVVDDTKVLQSYEADCVRYILEAFLHYDQNTVLKALATPFTSYEIEELGSVDISAEMTRFIPITEAYEKSGIYAGLMKFAQVYHSFDAIRANEYLFPERTITNYLQIADLLNERQFRYGDDLSSLIDWLLKVKSRDDLPDEYEQQLESDQDAVNIVTIHKSKGLSYKVVFVYFDDKPREKKNEMMEYQSVDGLFYYNYRGLDEEVDAMQVEQQHQENRRLWYVALTRAVYKTYICYKALAKNVDPETSPLATIPHLKNRLENNGFFDQLEVEEELVKWRKKRLEEEGSEGFSRKVDHSIPFSSSWSVSSYSSIRKKDAHHAIEKTKLDDLEGYNEFVFHRMPRGASAGDFLHQIFERVDFTQPEKIKPFLERFQNSSVASSYFKKDTLTDYEAFINHVLGTKLEINGSESFAISAISKKLPEMEFYFSIDDFNKETLKTRFKKPFSFEYPSYKGYVYGLIDLFFEHEGKYYILDWKSNHLGDTVEEYSADRVEEAMTLSNYHLQYLIYTISVCRFLKQTLPDFNYEKDFGGVFYVFLRGCRAGETSGVFAYKPEWSCVREYLV